MYRPDIENTYTAAHKAAEEDNVEKLKELYRENPEFCVTYSEGMNLAPSGTPFACAVRNLSERVIQYYIDEKLPLFETFRGVDDLKTKSLEAIKESVGDCSCLLTEDHPLIVLCDIESLKLKDLKLDKRIAILNQLVNAGLNVNICFNHEYGELNLTPLNRAVLHSGGFRLVDELLSLGASNSLESIFDGSIFETVARPWFEMAQNGYVEVLGVLLAHSEFCKILKEKKRELVQAIWIAVANSKEEYAKRLLSCEVGRALTASEIVLNTSEREETKGLEPIHQEEYDLDLLEAEIEKLYDLHKNWLKRSPLLLWRQLRQCAIQTNEVERAIPVALPCQPESERSMVTAGYVEQKRSVDSGVSITTGSAGAAASAAVFASCTEEDRGGKARGQKRRANSSAPSRE